MVVIRKKMFSGNQTVNKDMLGSSVRQNKGFETGIQTMQLPNEHTQWWLIGKYNILNKHLI